MKSKAISVLLALVMLTVAAGVFAKQEKVTICHKPGTEDEETLSVAAAALDAHLGHGDYAGECEPLPPPGPPGPGCIGFGTLENNQELARYYDFGDNWYIELSQELQTYSNSDCTGATSTTSGPNIVYAPAPYDPAELCFIAFGTTGSTQWTWPGPDLYYCLP